MNETQPLVFVVVYFTIVNGANDWCLNIVHLSRITYWSKVAKKKMTNLTDAFGSETSALSLFISLRAKNSANKKRALSKIRKGN